MADGKSILIIDDEHMIRNILSKILTKEGHEAFEAKTGEEALNLIRQDITFDYIVLDLNLSGDYSGKETFLKIKQGLPSQKIIISSGYIDPDDHTFFNRSGAHAILEKPFPLTKFISLIEE